MTLFALDAQHLDLKAGAETFARRYFSGNAYSWTSYPWRNARLLADHGYTGIAIPAPLGGQGGTLLQAVLVLESVARVCPHTGDAAHSLNFGAIQQIAHFANGDLVDSILPHLLAGEALLSVGMSEPDAGSAVTALRTSAKLAGGDVIVTGQKAWGTHSMEASHSVVWCRFGDEVRSIGAVLVPLDAKGVTRGPAQTYLSGDKYCTIFYDNVRVPKGNILVQDRGLSKMLGVFGVERLGNATRSLALAEAAFDLAVEHARDRAQFNRPLSEFQGLQWKFADMRMRLDAARLLIYRAASEAANGIPAAANVAIAKCYANEAAFGAANEALQILGASGYSSGSRVEYLFRKIRGWMVAGGSTEILRNQIAQDIFDRRFSQWR